MLDLPPMLSALLLAGLFAAPLATAALFVPARGRSGDAADGRWRALAGIGITLVAAVVLIGISVGILAAIGATATNLVAAAVGLGVATVVWLPATGRWGTRARLCWA
ncbi:MAG: hypothetical protein ACRDLV_06500, partial [Solirubrobacteraceae bacterium]